MKAHGSRKVEKITGLFSGRGAGQSTTKKLQKIDAKPHVFGVVEPKLFQNAKLEV